MPRAHSGKASCEQPECPRGRGCGLQAPWAALASPFTSPRSSLCKGALVTAALVTDRLCCLLRSLWLSFRSTPHALKERSSLPPTAPTSESRTRPSREWDCHQGQSQTPTGTRARPPLSLQGTTSSASQRPATRPPPLPSSTATALTLQ